MPLNQQQIFTRDPAPANPNEGDYWIDVATALRYQWRSGQWVAVTTGTIVLRGDFDPVTGVPALQDIAGGGGAGDHVPGNFYIATATGLYDFATATPGSGTSVLQGDEVYFTSEDDWIVITDPPLALNDLSDVTITGGQEFDTLVRNNAGQYINVDSQPRFFDGAFTGLGLIAGDDFNSANGAWQVFDEVGLEFSAATGGLTFNTNDAGVYQFNIFVGWENFTGANNGIINVEITDLANAVLKEFNAVGSNQITNGQVMYSVSTRLDSSSVTFPISLKIRLGSETSGAIDITAANSAELSVFRLVRLG